MAVRRASTLTVLAAVACIAAGCGGSDEDRIRDVADGVQAALAEGDVDGVCSRLTTPARAQVASVAHGGGPAKTCATELVPIVRAMRREARAHPLPPPRVVRVSVDGDRAVAELRITRGIATKVPFAVEDGEWRADAVWGRVPAARQEDKYP
ncbi:MAG: hypothetical protein WD993_08595 [Thermoleophilaceae bacterium]